MVRRIIERDGKGCARFQDAAKVIDRLGRDSFPIGLALGAQLDFHVLQRHLRAQTIDVAVRKWFHAVFINGPVIIHNDVVPTGRILTLNICKYILSVVWFIRHRNFSGINLSI